MSRVAVALSGGLDSSVAALLLLQQGHEVVGITAKMIASEDSNVIVENAKEVAKKLNIEHYVIDSVKDFNEKIISYFENSYKLGETPNPCILCNKYIKWGSVFNYAIENLGVDYIATGHYANLKKDVDAIKLYPASDEHKDQLYFLFTLSQEKLAKTLFPLSNYKKSEVREIAFEYDLPTKSSKESQDICFIKPPMTTKKYLNNLFASKEGNFIEKKTGKLLGYHSGYWQYTIGQRKGIGIAAKEPLYVLEIDSQLNNVYLGNKEELYANKLILNNVDWSYDINKKEFNALVKIRYNMKAVSAKIICRDKVEVLFSEPVSGLASGQACVFYDMDDGHLLGGGFI